MTNKETVNRNIGLSFDFIRQIIRHPDILKEIKGNSVVIEFLQKDYPEKVKSDSIIADKYIKVKRKFEIL